MKLCKDCKWCALCNHPIAFITGTRYEFAKCRRSISLVDGKPKQDNFCDNERRSYGGCGADAKYWEAKE